MDKNNKLNVEIKRINKKTKQVEWTDTIEIPYEKNNEKVSIELKKDMENKDVFVPKEKEELKITLDQNTKMPNPFHQPSMNTIEFERNNTTTIISITKDNETITYNDKLKALDDLLNSNIITKKEFDEKKQLILSQMNKKK
ncbi:MAG: SHOCT domain-containing protein [Mycoplasma sp.]|nr:SHOCT domain-containing protein [Mycoplasma sp.]